MSLRETFGNWIKGSDKVVEIDGRMDARATDPIAFHLPSGEFYGHGLATHQPSHETLLRESLGIADLATRAIANRVSTLNPQVLRKVNVGDGKMKLEVIDDHPLKMLLDRPHPDFSRAMMLRLLTQYVVTVGEAFWLKVGPRSSQMPPVELHPIQPDLINPKLHLGVVTGWIAQDGNGARFDIDQNDVIRFYFPDPESPWQSEGYLGPSGTTVDANKFANEQLRTFYQHDATPKAWLQTDDTALEMSAEQKEAFKADWRNSYNQRNGTDVGLPGILAQGYSIVSQAISSGADVTPLLEHWRDNILLAFGVPRSVLGQVVSGDRSSAETNQYVMDRHTIKPIANLISDQLTLKLAPDYAEEVVVVFEEFVSDDKVHELAREKQDLETKLRSINMVHEDRGTELVDWGDEPVGKLGEVPYDPSALSFEPVDDDPSAFDPSAHMPEEIEQPDEDEDEERTRASTRELHFSPTREWHRQILRERKWIPAFLRAVRKAFKLQRDSVLEKLIHPERVRITADDIIDDRTFREIFGATVDPVRAQAFNDIGLDAIAGLGADPNAFLFSGKVEDILRKQGAALVQHANRTTKRLLRKQLAAAADAGESISQISARIREVFNVRRSHAVTIARTEMLKASQEAQVTGFELSGVVHGKEWNTSRDDDVRETHEIDGQRVPLDQAFTLDDGEQADAPGIGAGGGFLSPGNAINCRCFVTPIVLGEGEVI